MDSAATLEAEVPGDHQLDPVFDRTVAPEVRMYELLKDLDPLKKQDRRMGCSYQNSGTISNSWQGARYPRDSTSCLLQSY